MATRSSGKRIKTNPLTKGNGRKVGLHRKATTGTASGKPKPSASTQQGYRWGPGPLDTTPGYRDAQSPPQQGGGGPNRRPPKAGPPKVIGIGRIGGYDNGKSRPGVSTGRTSSSGGTLGGGRTTRGVPNKISGSIPQADGGFRSFPKGGGGSSNTGSFGSSSTGRRGTVARGFPGGASQPYSRGTITPSIRKRSTGKP